MKLELNKIYCGDSLKVLKTFPDKSIDCIMTSPPYWALRDYGHKGQLGLEPIFQEYITKLCDIFDEIKRVLKPTGTCWVNMGDTYGTSSGSGIRENKQVTNRGTQFNKGWQEKGKAGVKLMQKSLCQIPNRFAIEMTNRGWILRNEIIWHKPNCMPQSVTDRFTVDFEKLFFFTKNQNYYFNQQKEPMTEGMIKRMQRGSGHHENRGFPNGPQNHIKKYFNKSKEEAVRAFELGRNKRCVWKITTKPFKDAHFAVYPEELCMIPINAGCPEGGGST